MVPSKLKHEDGNKSTASKTGLIKYGPSRTLVIFEGASVGDRKSILHIIEGNCAVRLVSLLKDEGSDIRH